MLRLVTCFVRRWLWRSRTTSPRAQPAPPPTVAQFQQTEKVAEGLLNGAANPEAERAPLAGHDSTWVTPAPTDLPEGSAISTGPAAPGPPNPFWTPAGLSGFLAAPRSIEIAGQLQVSPKLNAGCEHLVAPAFAVPSNSAGTASNSGVGPRPHLETTGEVEAGGPQPSAVGQNADLLATIPSCNPLDFAAITVVPAADASEPAPIHRRPNQRNDLALALNRLQSCNRPIARLVPAKRQKTSTFHHPARGQVVAPLPQTFAGNLTGGALNRRYRFG